MDLAGGFVKEIGPALAKKLVGHFGAEVYAESAHASASIGTNPPNMLQIALDEY